MNQIKYLVQNLLTKEDRFTVHLATLS
jgi:hypothetical protein